MSRGTAVPVGPAGTGGVQIPPCLHHVLGRVGAQSPPACAAPGLVSAPCGFSRDFHHFPGPVSCFSSSCPPHLDWWLSPLTGRLHGRAGMWVCRTYSPRCPAQVSNPLGSSCPLQTGLAPSSHCCDRGGRAVQGHPLAPGAGLGGGFPHPRRVSVSGCDSHRGPATRTALQTTAAA